MQLTCSDQLLIKRPTGPAHTCLNCLNSTSNHRLSSCAISPQNTCLRRGDAWLSCFDALACTAAGLGTDLVACVQETVEGMLSHVCN